MKLVGSGEQHARHFTYPADGAITSATLPKLLLPEHSSRSALFIQNTSTSALWFGFGSARATCTMAGGAITATAITNGGFGFTRPPRVRFYGGGIMPPQGIIGPNTSYVGAPGPGFPSPQHPATGHAVLTGAVVTSIVIDDPGVGYVSTPMVFLANDPLDPNGCFDPSLGGGSGWQLNPGQNFSLDNTVCTTDAVAVFGATLAATFACWWMT